MALPGMTAVLEELRERSRWRLVVHPDDVEEARVAVITAHMVPQVQVVANRRVGPGDAYLLSPEVTYQFHGFNDNDSMTSKIGA